MLPDMPDYERYTFIALLVCFVVASLLEGDGRLKIVLALCFAALIASADVEAGSREHKSKGRAKPPPQTVIEQQTYMHWLQNGCPPLVQPRQTQRQLPTWGSEGRNTTSGYGYWQRKLER